jgi:valyl-tRNA synthetase
MAELNKSYDPQQVEDRIYQFWMQNNYFDRFTRSKLNLSVKDFGFAKLVITP